VLIRSGADGEEFLWGGLEVQLYKDEAESYYHNLLAPTPQLYVITRPDDQGRPAPFLVTASYDAANAYTEAQEDAYPTPLPAELYPWLERFVLTHYVPQPRHKRKRQNWQESDHE
jgi:hypothetical protein